MKHTATVKESTQLCTKLKQQGHCDYKDNGSSGIHQLACSTSAISSSDCTNIQWLIWLSDHRRCLFILYVKSEYIDNVIVIGKDDPLPITSYLLNKLCYNLARLLIIHLRMYRDAPILPE